jgi:hypothetical protein
MFFFSPGQYFSSSKLWRSEPSPEEDKFSKSRTAEAQALQRPGFRAPTRVARFFLVQKYQIGKSIHTKWPQVIPNGYVLYQIVINYSKLPWNIPTFSIPRHSKIYPNWGF